MKTYSDEAERLFGLAQKHNYLVSIPGIEGRVLSLSAFEILLKEAGFDASKVEYTRIDRPAGKSAMISITARTHSDLVTAIAAKKKA